MQPTSLLEIGVNFSYFHKKAEKYHMGYIDPGLFGIISQLGLALVLTGVSVFMFFFKPIKRTFLRLIGREDKFDGGDIKESDNGKDN